MSAIPSDTNMNAPATRPGPLTEADFAPRRDWADIGHRVLAWTAAIGLVGFVAGVAMGVIK